MTNNFNLNTQKFILASQSPRRKQLLSEAGFNFEVKVTDADESFDDTIPVEKVAQHLAIRKAQAAKQFIQNDEIVIAADSTVILDQKIYNKPQNYEEAFQFIRDLSGKMHKVVTGVCLLSKTKQKAFSGITKVWFDELSDEEIEYYINTCQPYDKAGAYGVQEWIGHCKIRKIEGIYTNVMGLPVQLIYKHLKKW